MILSREPRLIGLGHLTFLNLPPAPLATLAAKAGFSFVGLRFHPAAPGGVDYHLPAGSQALRELKAHLSAVGVGVYDIEVLTIDPSFSAARLEPILEAAAFLGARRFNISGDDHDLGRLSANLAELAEMAFGYGMGVDLEPMAWRSINSVAAALDLIERAGSSNCNLLIDSLHLARTGGVPATLVGLAAGVIRSAQLCDAPARAPGAIEALITEARSARLAPGEGELPVAELLNVLPDSVVLSVEAPLRSDDPAPVQARRLFDAARRLTTVHD